MNIEDKIDNYLNEKTLVDWLDQLKDEYEKKFNKKFPSKTTGLIKPGRELFKKGISPKEAVKILFK